MVQRKERCTISSVGLNFVTLSNPSNPSNEVVPLPKIASGNASVDRVALKQEISNISAFDFLPVEQDTSISVDSHSAVPSTTLHLHSDTSERELSQSVISQSSNQDMNSQPEIYSIPVNITANRLLTEHIVGS